MEKLSKVNTQVGVLYLREAYTSLANEIECWNKWLWVFGFLINFVAHRCLSGLTLN